MVEQRKTEFSTKNTYSVENNFNFQQFLAFFIQLDSVCDYHILASQILKKNNKNYYQTKN
jgi:hypothetical protein